MTDDPHRLERFVEAQREIYPRALDELAAGAKRSHWMWFIFPQLAGLGRSPTAQAYAVASLDEARAYLGHPLLGPRLYECVEALLALPRDREIERVLGPIDATKLRSSLTLFEAADGGAPLRRALDRFFAGERDPLTLVRLK
ncbi:DUF1810 domain-containing protein [Sphingomonas ginkgonis]|uniref:DUF1810 domain-containing protein n=1 Tax=Sphingomonas ginkgonis TaxID=2315330 RepID=A0A3R9YKV6_9SPHN|nr:DUF1810 domain-containing protein [Sphingomonas ginkgonis]RST29821.1 DUF1810 domain-containing protein [Sphingomonas ginkgonis]